MLVTITGDRVQVTLSRRNLRQLNHVLENNGGCNKYLVRRDESGLLLVVHVEDDDDHYDEEQPRARRRSQQKSPTE